MPNILRFLLKCLLVLAACLAGAAGASEHSAAPPGAATAAPSRPAQPAPASSTDAIPLSARALEDARGGSVHTATDTRLSANVAGNSAHQVATGSNAIQGGAFAGAVGIPVVIQNTGANVLIQHATVVNLRIE